MGVTADEGRCDRCGWPLKATTAEGCTADSCSMRPMPPTSAERRAAYAASPLGKAEATIADLCAKLELFREHLCGDCKCAPKAASHGKCWDCHIYHYSRAWAPDWSTGAENYAASHISVGMRALCGRRIFG